MNEQSANADPGFLRGLTPYKTSTPPRLTLAWLLLVALVAAACTSASTEIAETEEASNETFETSYELRSPDGDLRIEIGIDRFERARYRVVRAVDGTEIVVLRDSTLGLETSVGSFVSPGSIEPVGSSELVTDSFDLPHGKARQSTVQARTQTLIAGELAIDLWVADTGVAFRYRLERPGESFTVDWERTSFAVPPASRSWLQEHDAPSYVTPAYERLRNREAPAHDPGIAPYGWTFPALFETSNTWTLITETALGTGAAGSHFSPAATDGEFLLDFANRGEGNGIGDPRPTATDLWESPWRLIVNSSDLGDLVESDLVRHLSPPAPDGRDFSWVRPGRVSWSWWSDHSSSRDADAVEPFIDMASELGWEYSLVDANWNLNAETFGEERLVELVDYARDRNVELFVWYNSGGSNNAVTEAPRDRMADSITRQAELAWLAEIGVAGIKVDFFHSDKPNTIQLYRDIMSDAADAGLMVHFHGSTVPRGWSREYPNLMTMEAVRGAEIYTFDRTYQWAAPRQNTVLPFTRNIVGSMDYTPVILGDEERRTTTNGHELALSVLFESPLLHLIDTPEAYLSQPLEVIDLLSSVPTVWDRTHFIDGEPESHVVIARQLDNEWWIGAISALDERRSITVELHELGVSGTATVLQVCDDPAWDRTEAGTYLDPSQYLISTPPANESFVLDLAANGGCLVRITSEN